MDFEKEAEKLMDQLWRADGVVYTKRDVIVKFLRDIFESGVQSTLSAIPSTPDNSPY